VAAGTGAAALPTSTTAAAEASSQEAEAEGADSSRRTADTRADFESAVAKRLYCIFFLKRKNCKKSLDPRAEINIYCIYMNLATVLQLKEISSDGKGKPILPGRRTHYHE
jgi:hypothetical protein